MSERPILFSGPMVRAILEGRKTQTRRVLKPSAYLRRYNDERRLNLSEAQLLDAKAHAARVNIGRGLPSPCGAPGDTLWVRETWAPSRFKAGDPNYAYRADGEREGVGRWRPSIHMPRRASRLTLRIKSVRVERLQEISEADAIAEGVLRTGGRAQLQPNHFRPARELFSELWDSINEDRAPWASNPWVWVVEFSRVTEGATAP